MIENDDVLKVYGIVSGQVITAGKDGTVVDLNHNALLGVMRLYKIQNRRSVFERVIQLFHSVLEIQQENNLQNVGEV